MLTREETITVTGYLANHLGASGDIRVLIQTLFAPDHTPILLALPTNIPGIEDQSRWLVQYCLACRWPPKAEQPSLLELLMVRLINNAGVGALAPLRDRVRVHTDPNDDVFQTRWVIANQPFFARFGTRQAIRQLIEGVSYPILRINGPECSGKSYTLELVAHLAEQGPSYVRFATAAVEPTNAPSYTVEELAGTLTVSMEINEPMPQRNTSSYPKSLCLWIIRNTLRQPAGVWVLVLDGFGNKNVRAEVKQLVEALSAQVLAPDVVKRVRLVLLDYDPPLPDSLSARTLDDTLPDPMTIGEQDLQECLLAYNKQRQQMGEMTKVIDPKDVGTLAASLLGRADSAPAERLRSLYKELRLLWQM